MTSVKLDTKLGGGPSAAIEPHVPGLYARPGIRILVIAELAHVERVQPAPDTDKEASVKMRITSMEIATKEQEGAVREAQRALYVQRTAQGTILEDGEIELAKHTLKLTGGLLTEIENARLLVGLRHWMQYAHRAAGAQDLAHSELLHELKAVADGLSSVLSRAREDEG